MNDMVRSPFPGWSAVDWVDIVPGAQTERRGGAGPVRSLLGGKDLTGRLAYWFCRTVLEAVLLFGLLGSHQFPRLRAEVPDGLAKVMARTNTPPAIDLIVRLVVPAAGL